MNKINRLTLLAALAVIASFSTPLLAKEDTRELPIGLVAKGYTITVSSLTWTKVQGSASNTRVSATRVGMKVNNPADNSYSVFGILSESTPTEATTIRPIEIQAGENPFVPVGDGIFLWLVSPSGEQSVHAQEVKQ